MKAIDWVLTFAALMIVGLLVVLIVLVRKTGLVCGVFQGYDAGMSVKGVYRSDGVIAFDYNQGVDTLFHELAHAQVDDSFNHFCVEGYK